MYTKTQTILAALVVAGTFTPQAAWAQPATDPWVRFGVATQRDAIAHDEPINWVMRLGAHNAYESFAYGHDTDPNQSLTVASQLDRGARIIALDVHVLDGGLKLCHGDYCAFDRVGYDRIMEEIGEFIAVRQDFVWVQIEYLPYAGCKALDNSECQDASLSLQQIADEMQASVIDHLDRGAGLVWKPDEALFVGIDEFGNEAYVHPKCSSCVPAGATHRQRYPTLRELQRAGKRAMVTATGMKGCCGDECGEYSRGSGKCSDHSVNAGASCSNEDQCEGLGTVVTWIWNDGALGGNINSSNRSGNAANFNAGLCEIDGRSIWAPDATTDGGYPAIGTISEDRTMIALSEGIGILEEDDMVSLARCNVGRINFDFFDRAQDMDALVCCWYDLFGQDCTPGVSVEAECPADDQRVARTIWSWKQDLIPDESLGHNYAFMTGVDGRWAAAIPQNNFRCACGVPRTGEPLDWEDKKGSFWEVTQATGFWDECPALCEAEFGMATMPLEFGVPVNGFQNERLYDKLKIASDQAGTDLTFENVWLRFRRETENGAGELGGWTKLVMPSIESVEYATNPDNQHALDFTIRVNNPDELQTMLILWFDDGQAPILEAPTIKNGQTVYRHTTAFVNSGQKVVDIELYSVNDTSAHEGALYLQDEFEFDFEYFPNFLPEFVDPIPDRTRAGLTPMPDGCSGNDCIGHLLEWHVRFSDDDDDFTQYPTPCQTQRLCQRGVTVLYGDEACVNGLCPGGVISCVDDADCAFVAVPEQISQVGPGEYEFLATHLYQQAGVYDGRIIVDDGKVQIVHDFTVDNRVPSAAPAIIPTASGCTRSELLTGEEVTCTIQFIDPNSKFESYSLDIDWGDGTQTLDFTDISVGAISPNRHLAYFDHVYTAASAPDLIPIRVTVRDGVSDPHEIRRCLGDSTVVCTTDADCSSGACGGLFEVKVFQGNTPPIVCLLTDPVCDNQSNTGGDVTIEVGDTLTRSFRVVDPDTNDDHLLSVRYAPDLPAEFPPSNETEVFNDTFTLQHTYDEPGLFELVFRVSTRVDGPEVDNSTGALSFLVRVVPENEPPTMEWISDTTIYETQALSKFVNFSDDCATDSNCNALVDDNNPNSPWIGYPSYGDGSTTMPLEICTDGPFCDFAPPSFELNHTYSQPGTYSGSIFMTDLIDYSVMPFKVNVLSVDDAYEPNDSCATAYPILPGTLERVIGHEVDTDWFSIFVGSGQELTVEAEIVESSDFASISILVGCDETFDWVAGATTLDSPIRTSYLNDGPGQVMYVQYHSGGGGDVAPFVVDITVSLSSETQDCNNNGVADVDEILEAGDFTGDGQVSLLDLPNWIDCTAGPNEPPSAALSECANTCLSVFDIDGDGDIDLLDYADYQLIFAGE